MTRGAHRRDPCRGAPGACRAGRWGAVPSFVVVVLSALLGLSASEGASVEIGPDAALCAEINCAEINALGPGDELV